MIYILTYELLAEYIRQCFKTITCKIMFELTFFLKETCILFNLTIVILSFEVLLFICITCFHAYFMLIKKSMFRLKTLIIEPQSLYRFISSKNYFAVLPYLSLVPYGNSLKENTFATFLMIFLINYRGECLA